MHNEKRTPCVCTCMISILLLTVRIVASISHIVVVVVFPWPSHCALPFPQNVRCSVFMTIIGDPDTHTHMRERKTCQTPIKLTHSLTQEERNLSPFHTKKPSSSSLTTGSGLTSSSASLFFFLLLLTRVLSRLATGVRASSSFSCSCSSSSESPAWVLRALAFLVAETDAEAEAGVDGRLRLVPLVGVCICEKEQ